jgi:hypothetical protein
MCDAIKKMKRFWVTAVIWYDILKPGEGASMYFAVDIDGTIAGANIPLLLSLCNKKSRLF